MSANSIQLANYFFPKLHVDANPGFKAQAHAELLAREGEGDLLAGVPLPESKIDVRRIADGDHPNFVAIQKIELCAGQHPCVPYSLDIECVGFFEWAGPRLSDEPGPAWRISVEHCDSQARDT